MLVPKLSKLMRPCKAAHFAAPAGASALASLQYVGSPLLSRACASVRSVSPEHLHRVERELHSALREFRAKYGFGRGMSAPQIGHPVRMIAAIVNGEPVTLCDPDVTPDVAAGDFVMFDDCMSAPDYYVRVRRYCSVSVRFTDVSGRQHTSWEASRVSVQLSELLQHEADHLDGITMFDRADGKGAIFHRSTIDAATLAQQGYVIGPAELR